MLLLQPSISGATSTLQNDVLGAVILLLFAALFWFIKTHRDERKEWRTTIERQFEKQNAQSTESTTALTALKTLIERKRKV